MRPPFLLGVVAAIGLIVNLGILTTSAAAPEVEIGPVDTAKPENQQEILNGLRTELDEKRRSQFPDLSEAEKNTRELFALGEEHEVLVASLINSEPAAEKLGRLNFEKLVTRVELQGKRADVIAMLLSMRDQFGQAMFATRPDGAAGATESLGLADTSLEFADSLAWVSTALTT